MAEDRRDAPRERLDTLDEQFARPAVRPIATRTRVPPSFDPADGRDPADPTHDREETADEDPIHPRTRVP